MIYSMLPPVAAVVIHETLVVPKLVLISTAVVAQAPGQLPNSQLLGQGKGMNLQRFWQLPSAIVAITWHLSEFEKKAKGCYGRVAILKNFPHPFPKQNILIW